MVEDMDSTYLSLEQSLTYVGENSTFQKRMTLIFAIQWVVFSFMVNAMAFFFHSPVFRCRVPLTDTFEPCSQSTACELSPNDYQVFSEGSQVSIVDDFNLYCSRSGYISQAQSLFFLGGFFSGFVFT
jgi:hypothetical protein